MSYGLKKISTIILSVMVITMAISIYCATIGANTRSRHTQPVSCEQVIGAVGSDVGGLMTCMRSHLTNSGQFIADTPRPSLLMLFGLLVLVPFLFKYLKERIGQPILSILRYIYRSYITWIKVLIEQKRLKYLSFIDSYSIVSLA